MLSSDTECAAFGVVLPTYFIFVSPPSRVLAHPESGNLGASLVTRQTTVAPGATLDGMASDSKKSERVFKTAWFTKAARKAHIPDEELCSAIRQVMLGRADGLGGGVFKKRLRKNQYRSIILARAGHYWVYEYLFAKQDRANIEDDELADFRKLVKAYVALTAHQVDQLIRQNHWTEICNDNQA